MLGRFWPVAQLAAAQEGSPPPQGFLNSPFVLTAVMLAILYFVWIRPASRDRKKHQEMLESLKRGDEILMQNGIFGTISDMSDKTMTIEVARNVKVRVLKSSISRKVEPAGAESKDKDQKAKEQKASK
ncbi:MAG: preprotein translocase subunit YajC [Myxococcota bacterium]